MRVHFTGKGRKRLDPSKCLEEVLGGSGLVKSEGVMADTWVYISGPNKFITAGEQACKERRASGKAIDWYGAKWHI